jgi:hypothetical protein
MDGEHEVKALLERTATEAGDLRVDLREVERAVGKRRTRRRARVVVGAGLAVAVLGGALVAAPHLRPTPVATALPLRVPREPVACGAPLPGSLVASGVAGTTLRVSAALHESVTRQYPAPPIPIDVTLASREAVQLAVLGRVPLQVVLLEDGVVVDRLASYAWLPDGPEVDWLAGESASAAQGGRGSIGISVAVAPGAPRTITIRGVARCPGANWSVAREHPERYTVVAVMSPPSTAERPGAVPDDAPLLASPPAPLASLL